VGKSYVIEKFGKSFFQNVVTVNFELQSQLKKCFVSLDPYEIINKLQLLMGVKIKQGESLLFLDEIQECPEAIMALRYFKEKMQGLHVVGAGSLLEFALNKSDFKMPVGRVQYIYLGPLSFGEYLDAFGYTDIREYLATVTLAQGVDIQIHTKLIELLRTYLLLGGMPAVIGEFLMNKDHIACMHLQSSLLETFRNDFAKYSTVSNIKYLRKVFDAAPRMVGSRIKYVHIDPETKSRDLKEALELLSLAGIIKKIHASASSGLPLGAQISEKKLKLNFLDIGLMQNACGIQDKLAVENDFMQINAGAVAEQLVGQELCAYADKYQEYRFYFWARDKKNSSAEIDYLTTVGSQIIPIEVKAGKTGKLKSLKLYMQEKKASLGVRCLLANISYNDHILSIPLYMIEQLPRFVR
ncbi:MAG: DUF4143 domain-containing protein, partial [bacterium]